MIPRRDLGVCVKEFCRIVKHIKTTIGTSAWYYMIYSDNVNKLAGYEIRDKINNLLGKRQFMVDNASKHKHRIRAIWEQCEPRC